MHPDPPLNHVRGFHGRIVLLRCTPTFARLHHVHHPFQRRRKSKRTAKMSTTPKKNTSLRASLRKRRGSEERRNGIYCCTPLDGILPAVFAHAMCSTASSQCTVYGNRLEGLERLNYFILIASPHLQPPCIPHQEPEDA